MSSKQRYTVGVFGVPEFEQQVLRRILSLSANRANTYEMVAEVEGSAADILLVDRNNARALAKMRDHMQGRARVPTVEIVGNQPTKQPHVVRRPFTATRMLGVLDQLVYKEIENAAPTGGSSPARRTPGNHPANQPEKLPPNVTGEAHLDMSTAGYRALVVDDSLPVRRQVGIALQHSGISADFADNGARALELLAHNAYDIIFLDVVMPGADGYEVCKTIKRDKTSKTIPVVMLTGRSSPFDKVKGKLSGCNTYLTKPVSLKEFKQTLNKCLSQSMAIESMVRIA
jgi:twitching motility two-component system response regulator PilG